MAAAFCITMVVSVACLVSGAAAPRALPARLIVLARAEVGVVFWLVVAIANVARLRFVSDDDRAGSAAGPSTAIIARANAILQNTLEQVVLAVVIHFALAVLVPSSAPLIWGYAFLFAVGRILFWSGYAGGAQARAFGFALTFYPSVAGLVVVMAAAAGPL